LHSNRRLLRLISGLSPTLISSPKFPPAIRVSAGARLLADDLRRGEFTSERTELAENERQSQEIKLLKEKIDLLIRRLFGSEGEKLDAAQLVLLLNDLDLGKAVATTLRTTTTNNSDPGS
jgi:hypothetical protein